MVVIDEYLLSKNIVFVKNKSSNAQILFSQLPSEFNLHVETSYKGCFQYLEKNKASVVIVESEIKDMAGIDLLFIIKGRFPTIKRVLIANNPDINEITEAINVAQLNLIINPNMGSGDISSQITMLIYEYSDYQNKLIKEYKEISNKAKEFYEVKSDDLLDLLFNLNEAGHIKDFTNQFMGVLEGMKSLMSLNAEVYLDNKEASALKNIIQQSSDIEVFANQFNQKIILLYIMTIRGYIFLLEEDFVNAEINLKGVHLIFDWLKTEDIDSSLINCIKVYPYSFKHETEDNQDKSKTIQPLMINFVEIQLRKLFAIDLAMLVNISDDTLRNHIEKQSSIQYFMILRKDLPVYEKIAKNTDVNSHLISAFIIALSSFLQEVIKTSGDIETISHNNGVILFYRVDDLQYILLSTTNDIRLRIALRHIAFETRIMVSEIPDNNSVSEDERKIINVISDEILGEY